MNPLQWKNDYNSRLYQSRMTQSLEKKGTLDRMREMQAEAQYLDFGLDGFQRVKTQQPSGLRNIGNTCYFNVFMQLLYHVNSIRDLFLQSQSQNDLTKSLKELFAKMLFSSLRYSDPTDVFDALKRGGMKVGQQYDFHEYVSLTLDTLEKCLAAQKGYDGISQDRYINKIFFGKMNQYFNNGQKLTRSVVKFGVITLDAKLKKLQDAFEAFRSYQIQGYKSDKGENTTATIKSQITQFPGILTFFVNRVDIENGQLVKNNIQFCYPEQLHLDTDSRIKTKITAEYQQIDNKIKLVEQQLKNKNYKKTLQSLKQTLDFLSHQQQFEDLDAEVHTSFGIIGTQQGHKQSKNRIQTYIRKLQNQDKLLQNRILALKEEKRVLACKTTSFHYSLFALMIHEGTAQSGHYYIIIKNNSKWWKFSDRHVSNISEQQAHSIASGKKNKSTNVCCIFYKQRQFTCDPNIKPAIAASLKSWVLSNDKQTIENVKTLKRYY